MQKYLNYILKINSLFFETDSVFFYFVKIRKKSEIDCTVKSVQNKIRKKKDAFTALCVLLCFHLGKLRNEFLGLFVMSR